MLKKQDKRPIPRDYVVILEHEGQTAEILPVLDEDHERVLAGDHAIPTKDLRPYITRRGRLWVLNAPDWYIHETKHLASVEHSRVIQAAVNYQRPGAARPQRPAWLLVLPWLLVAALAVGLVVKK